MITEDYCSYEVAKLLKEKGFDESCRAVYEEEVLRINTLCDYHNSELSSYICAPTHQMAMSWLREINNIIVVIEPHVYDYPNEKTSSYVFAIWQGDNYMEIYSYKNSGLHGISYPTYKEAVETALKYCLENLI